MKHQFLIGTSQLQQAFEADRPCGCGSHDNKVSRRSFMKRTGGATVAAFLAAGAYSSAAANPAPGKAGHCNRHSKVCSWVTNIEVKFTSATSEGLTEEEACAIDCTVSGRVFNGTMTWYVKNCKSGRTEKFDAPVHSGGYLDPDSSVDQDDDTCCPALTNTVSATPSGNVGGFLVNGTGNRTAIMIHRPGGSSGCIVFDVGSDWETFRKHMVDGNMASSGCVHNPAPPQPKVVPEPVPIWVSYNVNPPPNGNNP